MSDEDNYCIKYWTDFFNKQLSLTLSMPIEYLHLENSSWTSATDLAGKTGATDYKPFSDFDEFGSLIPDLHTPPPLLKQYKKIYEIHPKNTEYALGIDFALGADYSDGKQTLTNIDRPRTTPILSKPRNKDLSA